MMIKGGIRVRNHEKFVHEISCTINRAVFVHEITIKSQSCTIVRARFFVHDSNDFM